MQFSLFETWVFLWPISLLVSIFLGENRPSTFTHAFSWSLDLL